MTIIHTKESRNMKGLSNEIDISKPAAIEEIRKDLSLGNGVLLKPTFEERESLFKVVNFIHKYGVGQLENLIDYAEDTLLYNE